MKQKTKWIRKCPNCNKILYYCRKGVMLAQENKQSVCSSCANSGINNPFYNKKHTIEHKKWLSETQKLVPHKYKIKKYNFKNPKVQIECPECKNKFIINPKNIYNKKFCTISCFNQWYLRNYHISKPELMAKNMLSNNNIKYIHQYKLDNKFYDFYIVIKNILVEIDGTYWHGKNKKYKELNETQKRIRKNDMLKNKIAKKHNYKLIRIWEDELNLLTEIIRKK